MMTLHVLALCRFSVCVHIHVHAPLFLVIDDFSSFLSFVCISSFPFLSLSLPLSLSVSLFADSDMPSSFSINLIDEKIPQCFLQLEIAIERLLMENPNQPLYKREAFWWVWLLSNEY